jgi:hypothetical protein
LDRVRRASGRTGCLGLQGPLFQIDEAKIVAQKAHDPSPLVDLPDSQSLAGKSSRNIDLFAVQADPASAAIDN